MEVDEDHSSIVQDREMEEFTEQFAPMYRTLCIRPKTVLPLVTPDMMAPKFMDEIPEFIDTLDRILVEKTQHEAYAYTQTLKKIRETLRLWHPIDILLIFCVLLEYWLFISRVCLAYQ